MGRKCHRGKETVSNSPFAKQKNIVHVATCPERGRRPDTPEIYRSGSKLLRRPRPTPRDSTPRQHPARRPPRPTPTGAGGVRWPRNEPHPKYLPSHPASARRRRHNSHASRASQKRREGGWEEALDWQKPAGPPRRGEDAERNTNPPPLPHRTTLKNPPNCNNFQIQCQFAITNLTELRKGNQIEFDVKFLPVTVIRRVLIAFDLIMLAESWFKSAPGFSLIPQPRFPLRQTATTRAENKSAKSPLIVHTLGNKSLEWNHAEWITAGSYSYVQLRLKQLEKDNHVKPTFPSFNNQFYPSRLIKSAYSKTKPTSQIYQYACICVRI